LPFMLDGPQRVPYTWAMVLSRQAILKGMKDGKIEISPFDEEDIEAAHINLHLKIDES